MIGRWGKSSVAISHHSSLSSPFDELRATISILLNLTLLVFVVKQVSLFFFPLPKKEPKKATAKEHLTGVHLVPANEI